MGVFNILGPLLNPANTSYCVIGVFSAKLVPLMADALAQLGVTKALVLHCQGLDELAPLGPATVAEVSGGQVSNYEWDPLAHGFQKCTIADLKGGDAVYNADAIRKVFSAELTGPI